MYIYNHSSDKWNDSSREASFDAFSDSDSSTFKFAISSFIRECVSNDVWYNSSGTITSSKISLMTSRTISKSFMDEKGQYFCSSDIPDMLFTFTTIVSIVLPSRPNKCIPLKLSTGMDDCTCKVFCSSSSAFFKHSFSSSDAERISVTCTLS